MFLVFGWTARVLPPASVSSPISVFVVRDELHRGLLLPSPSGGFVEFGFGDWEWYARAQEQWHRVFATVLWPTRGTLARREHFANDATSLRASMEVRAAVGLREASQVRIISPGVVSRAERAAGVRVNAVARIDSRPSLGDCDSVDSGIMNESFLHSPQPFNSNR